HFGRKQRYAASFQDGGVPHGLQSGSATADEAKSTGRRTVSSKEIGGADLIERVQSRVEGPIFIREVVKIRPEVQRGELRERMLTEEFELAAVQPELAKRLRVGEHFWRVHPAVDPSQQMLAARVVQIGQIELAHVGPELLV